MARHEKKYKCDKCKYVYDENRERDWFDFVCPKCGNDNERYFTEVDED